MWDDDLETIRLERRDGVALVTLHRPHCLNAIDGQMIAEVHRVLDGIEDDDDIGAVVVAGAGRSFCSGFDLKQDTAGGSRDEDGWREVLGRDFVFLLRFWEFPKPTLAAVHGHCLAGGFQLALCCDLTLAADNAVFGSPELRFGSVVTALILPWLVGPKIAKEVILAAEDGVSATRGYEAGFVNRVLAPGALLPETLALARRMARLDADALRGTKAAINRSLEVGGMGAGLRAALDQAIAIETLDTPSRRRFREIAARDGLRAALAWRDARVAGAAADEPPP